MGKSDKTLSKILSRRGRKSDAAVPFCMLVLFALGVAFIYSAQSYLSDELSMAGRLWVKQAVFVCVGLPVYFLFSYFDYKWLFQNAHLVYLGCLLLLLPLAAKELFGIPIPLVETRYNATRWINLGLFSLQPSEYAKIGTLVMLAAMLARNKIGTFKKTILFWIKLALAFAIPILFIFIQPDLGSSLVFFPMLFSMLYISELPKRFFVLAIALVCIVIGLVALDINGYYNYLQKNNMTAAEAASMNAYGSSGALALPMKDYQRNRILAFALPDVVDKSGTAITWNQRQSLISVGSGGFWGKGFAEGTQAKLGYLPSGVAYNDFIFSVVAEEGGFVVGALSIVLLAVIVYRCVRTAQLSRDKFGQYLCIGIAAIFITHIFVNVGMTIGVMPVKGLPLPMLSYGGSFVLACCILLGIVQSVYRHRREYS